MTVAAAGRGPAAAALIKEIRMKSIKNLALAGSVALAAATSVCAQNTHAVDRDNRPLATDSRDYNRVGENNLTQANKASGLIGMDVKNQHTEKLGDIKDLVVDLHSGKIAYAVLSVGGFLGIGDKYIAVPPSEFHVGPDGKELILNADKTRIQNAPGFAKNNWPDLNNPTWHSHSAYWMPEGSALGTAGAVRSGTGGTLYGKDQGVYSGKILAVDGATKTVTIEGASGKRVFDMDRATISTRGESRAHLDNLQVGDHVTVRYHEQNGKEVADSVIDSQQK